MQRHASDALTLQEEAAAEIAEQLRPRLTPAERKRIVKRHTANPRAFEAHLKGRYQLAKRTLDGFTKAIAFFEQAIVEDREYALAYAGLADCWTLLSAAAYGEPSARTMARAREAAEQALRLDPSDTEVQTALGFVRFRIDWDWHAAEAAFVRACELSPGHAPAHHRLALLLSALGRHEEAIVEIRRAHDLDPLSLINLAIANGLPVGTRPGECVTTTTCCLAATRRCKRRRSAFCIVGLSIAAGSSRQSTVPGAAAIRDVEYSASNLPAPANSSGTSNPDCSRILTVSTSIC